MIIGTSERIAALFDQVSIGTIEFKGSVMPAGKELWSVIEESIGTLEEKLKLEDVNKNENIAGARKFYKTCGKDPNRYRPSADSLRRRIVKGNGLYKVNNVVDVLNLISLKTGISIGGYDIEKIEGDIRLDTGRQDDEYIGIGRGTLNIEYLPVLRDSHGVFGSPTSDSERTMINERSNKICFVFFDFNNDPELDKHLDNSIYLLEKYAGADDISKETLQI